MLIKWVSPAEQDLSSLVDWHESHAPEYLTEVAEQIWEAAQSLSRFPERGRIGQVDGTRELLIPKLPYILVYTINEEMIVILRLLHQHQNWPES